MKKLFLLLLACGSAAWGARPEDKTQPSKASAPNPAPQDAASAALQPASNEPSLSPAAQASSNEPPAPLAAQPVSHAPSNAIENRSLAHDHFFTQAMHEAFPLEAREKAVEDPQRYLPALPFPVSEKKEFIITVETILKALAKIFNGSCYQSYHSQGDGCHQYDLHIKENPTEPISIKEGFKKFQEYLASLSESKLTDGEQAQCLAFFAADPKRLCIFAAYENASKPAGHILLLPEYQERSARFDRILQAFKNPEGSAKTEIDIMIDLFTGFISMSKSSVIFGAIAEESPLRLQNVKSQIKRIQNKKFNKKDLKFLRNAFFHCSRWTFDSPLAPTILDYHQAEGEKQESFLQDAMKVTIKHLFPDLIAYEWIDAPKNANVYHVYTEAVVRHDFSPKPLHPKTLEQIEPLVRELVTGPSFKALSEEVEKRHGFSEEILGNLLFTEENQEENLEKGSPEFKTSSNPSEK